MTKILTIDDEVEFTNLIQNYFGARGYNVFVANQGDAGLSLAKKERPDVYLSDLTMAGMHGDEVLREIMILQPEAKCIMITASEGEGKTRAKLLEMGAIKCFDKPLSSLKDLEKAIHEALNHD